MQNRERGRKAESIGSKKFQTSFSDFQFAGKKFRVEIANNVKNTNPWVSGFLVEIFLPSLKSKFQTFFVMLIVANETAKKLFFERGKMFHGEQFYSQWLLKATLADYSLESLKSCRGGAVAVGRASYKGPSLVQLYVDSNYDMA